MEPQARFVLRPGENGTGLLVGVYFTRNLTGILIPNHVYEVSDVMGETLVRHVGESSVGETLRDYRDRPDAVVPNVCWGNDISHILTSGDGAHCLTREELVARRKYQLERERLNSLL